MNSVLQELLAAPSGLTAAVALCLELEAKHITEPEELLVQKPRIDAAIKQTEQDIAAIARVLIDLRQSAAVASTAVPVGF